MATMVSKGCHCSQKGQALLEMALITPLLLALALGVIELGRYAYFAILVGNAAHAGAAYGAQGVQYAQAGPRVSCSAAGTGIQQAACKDFEGNGQDPGDLSIGSSLTCGCNSGGSLIPYGCSAASGNPNAGTCTVGRHWIVMVSVEARGTFQSLFNYPGMSSITIDRVAMMRVAQQ